MWVKIWGKSSPDAEVEESEECAIVWSAVLQQHTLVETSRVTAGQDKVANEARGTNQLMAFALRRADRQVGLDQADHR